MSSHVLNSLKGLSAIVSGGGNGLGYATAKRLVQQGCNVLVCDLNKSKLFAEIENDCLFQKTDITSESEVQSAIALAESKFKRLNILVNCAGIGYAQKIYSVNQNKPHTLDNFEKVLKVNVTGTFNMMRLAIGLMLKVEPNFDGQRGVIVNTSSLAAFEGQTGQVAYSASKGAIAAMTLPVARDLARSGIRVMAIAPGLFDTELLAGLPENVRKQLMQTVPCPQRLGHPDEFAHLVQSIVCNPMLNGEVIRLDGALRMQP